MEIVKLNSSHIEAIRPLFRNTKYMGANIFTNYFVKDASNYENVYDGAFCDTYLSDLSSFHAFGAFDEDGNIQGAIAYYQSVDEASWYGTNIRNIGAKTVVQDLLDAAIKANEEVGLYKFYTLWSAKHMGLLRRFAFSDWANERYDYFDEFIVPAKTQCAYNVAWQVLFNRVLLPVDTVVRCTFLKQQYRNLLPVGGRI